MSWKEKIARMIYPDLRSEGEIRSLVADELKRAQADMPISIGYDPKNEGYRKLSGTSSSNRDLTPMTQGRMIEIAYYMYDSSAFLHRMAHMDRSFLFSEPIRLESDDPDVLEILKRFWNDPENKMDINFPEWSMWLGILGEQLWPVDVNPANGHVRLRYVDPAEINEVWVNPLNTMQRMQVEAMGRNGRPGPKYAVIRSDSDIRSKSYDRLVGECFFITMNCPPNANRGRSDYLTLFDWFDGLERYAFNFLERAEFMLNFVWDVTMSGMNEEQIRAWLRDNPPPEPGSIRAHNENVAWAAVAPDIKATEFKSGYDMGKSFIMGSLGRPDSWFGEGGKAYQTEADIFGQVPIKDLDQRQLFLKYELTRILQFVVDQAVIAGRLSAEKAAKGFRVQMPEISKRDLTKLVNGIPQLSTALSVARQEGWMSQETAAMMWAYVCGYLGYAIDAKAEIEKTKDEKATEPLKDYLNR
jgi:hypothetical protein